MTQWVIAFLLLTAGGGAALAGTQAQHSGGDTPSSSAKTVRDGAQVFKSNCAICHFSGSTAKKIGPGLKGLYTRGRYADGKKVDDESLRLWIKNGRKDMPGFGKLKDDEVRALIAYIKTL